MTNQVHFNNAQNLFEARVLDYCSDATLEENCNMQNLFKASALVDFSGAILGLEENKEILEEQFSTAKIVMWISGFTFAAVTTAFVFTNVAIMPIVFAMSAAGMTAALIYLIYLSAYMPEAIDYNGKLLQAFQAITIGEHERAMELFYSMIRPHWRGGSLEETDIVSEYHEFADGVEEGFAYLDFRCPSIRQDLPKLESLFAKAALLNAFQKFKYHAPVSEETCVKIRNDMNRANRLTSNEQRSREEQAAYDLFLLNREQEQIARSPILAQVRLPQRISIGHGLLLKMIEQLRSFSNEMFDSEGNLHDGLEGENLQVWKFHLDKIKKQFERDHLGTDFDRGFIDRLLQVHTMREFWQVIQTISDSEIEAFEGRFVQYQS